jgi:hypothetical protein
MEMIILTYELDESDKKNGEYMKEEIHKIFSGFFGEYILLNISQYLVEPIDTLEKKNSWSHVLNTLSTFKRPELDSSIEESIKKGKVNWPLVEAFIEKSRNKIGISHDANVYEYTDILNNFEMSKDDVDFCNSMFKYMNSEKQINYMHDLIEALDDDLRVLSERYRNEVEKADLEKQEVMSNLNDLNTDGSRNKLGKSIGMINLPKTILIGCEYRKFTPFSNVKNLIYKFSPKIDEIRNVLDNGNIYVVKGINLLPDYKESKLSIFKFGFSFVLGVKVSSKDYIPDGMKAFTIPSHKYVYYTSNANITLKDLITEDVSTINFLDEKFTLSKFPMIELYSRNFIDRNEDNVEFNTYIPVE